MENEAKVINGIEGGKHVVEGPVTTDITRENAPGFLLNEIDKRIVKIRPMATPIDQLSRCAGAKRSESMIVDYYTVDTKPTSTTVTEAFAHNPAVPNPSTKLKVADIDIFEVSDTVLVKGVKGYDTATTRSNADTVLYVRAKTDTELDVIALNGWPVDEYDHLLLPDIPQGTTLIRMGRAATELDVQTAQFESLPQKAQNFCQIFKMQVENSTLQRIARKEVGWELSDQEECAVYDMKLGMEKSFLFGVKSFVYDNNKKENVRLTGGIWPQAGKEFIYQANSLNQDTLVDIMREAFTGNAGSKRKVLLGGSGLIGRLNKLSYSKVISANESVTKWGIDFTELQSKFGKLYVLLSEIFDECGMADNGLVVDPDYLQKYCHIPFNAEELNLKQSGIRNTDALVLTEASCLVLRYPKAHMRIVCQ